MSVRLQYRKAKVHARNLAWSRTGTILTEPGRSSCVSPSPANPCPPGIGKFQKKRDTYILIDNFSHVNIVKAFQLFSGSAECTIAHIIYLIINYKIRNSLTTVSTGIS